MPQLQLSLIRLLRSVGYNITNGNLNSSTVTETTSITDGLVLHLDTKDSNSYSGSGDTWYDLSGNNYDATIAEEQIFQQSICS